VSNGAKYGFFGARVAKGERIPTKKGKSLAESPGRSHPNPPTQMSG